MMHTIVLRAIRVLLFAAAVPLVAGCSGAEPAAPSDNQPTGEKPMTIELTSTAFDQGKPIPAKYTGEGEDVSPPLRWANVPEGTRELALICDDPDAPREEPWVHWVIYKLPADIAGLPEGIEPKPELTGPVEALQGKNSWPSGRTIGYRGPMPPPGKPHRYFFKLYALDTELDAEPGLSKDTLLAKMKNHILGTGQLMGTYKR